MTEPLWTSRQQIKLATKVFSIEETLVMNQCPSTPRPGRLYVQTTTKTRMPKATLRTPSESQGEKNPDRRTNQTANAEACRGRKKKTGSLREGLSGGK